MDIYVLDDNLKTVSVIDSYESFIWTERYASHGEFELHIVMTSDLKNVLNNGTKLSIQNSKRLMVVDTLFNDTTDGKNVTKITGSSLEKIFEDRIVNGGAGLGVYFDTAPWYITSKPEQVVRFIVDQICRLGSLSVSDKIPYLQPVSSTSFGTLPHYDSYVDLALATRPIYETINVIANAFGFGYRLVKKFPQLPDIYFEVYTGDDRTTNQSQFTPVIFSPEFENLGNITELSSDKDYKNVAIVFTDVGHELVYATGTDANTSGFKRKVLCVDATDITLPLGTELTNTLIQRGREALYQQQTLYILDGEISPLSNYKYMTDYNLGDIVEFQNYDGVSNYMKVTEQIFISDAEGERSYPTLSTQTTITPGSWYALDLQEWDVITGVWDDY